MARIFLSYSHEEGKSAEALEHGLCGRSIEVWRDKTGLHAGEKWPKALGEAIQKADALLLIWSAAAARSEFVELEWNIALALKKPVLPILSDETALPAALCATHSITEREPDRMAERVESALKALDSITAETATGQEAFITQLDSLSQRDPRAVLRTVKVLVEQPGWTVAGPVYHASGDIHIHGDSTKEESLPRRWQVWVGIIVGVLTAGMLLKQLLVQTNPEPVHTNPPSLVSLSPSVPSGQGPVPTAPVSWKISGIIADESDNPVQGAKVVWTGPSTSTVTDAGGHFSLLVHETHNKLVRLSITKEGYQPLSDYFPLSQDIHGVLHRE